MLRMVKGGHARILVVDDDDRALDAMAAILEDDGYEVETAEDASAARGKVERMAFDLIVQDLMLPDDDGLLLCSEFSRLGLPVLVCSATARRADGTLALWLGAEGFIAKPFDAEEFSARVARILASQLARGSAQAEPRPQTVGNLRMEQARRRVQVGEREIEITPTEFRLLFALAKASGQVVSRSDLAAAAWGHEEPSDGRSIDAHLSRLRSKLTEASADVHISSVRGEGYRLLSRLDQAA